MKVTIEVKDRVEAEAVRTAMADKIVRAFVLVVGTLSQLPSARARERVLRFVADKVDEEARREP